MHRTIAALSVALMLAAASAQAQSALEQEFAQADEDAIAALKTIDANCRQQMLKFWSFAAGQRCKSAVDAWKGGTPELTRFVGDLGHTSFLVSQAGDACQKDLQQGQDADKEKPYDLAKCPNQEEHMPSLERRLDKLKALLQTRP